MKNLILSLLLAFGVFAGVRANTAAVEFYANDAQIEQAFAAAEYMDAAVSALDSEASALAFASAAEQGAKLAPHSDDKVAAVILCFFFGGLAIHRVYLGGTPLLILAYFCTCGGLGLATGMDFINLVANGTDKFIDNNKFFVW